MIRFFATVVLSCLLVACSTNDSHRAAPDATVRPLTAIASLDATRYMGGWYEIAKYPNWFQRNCVRDTKAEYQLLPNGQVKVTNRCRDKSGAILEAVGAARRNATGPSSEFEVRFAPDWLAFIPLLWADYWVIDIDGPYQLAAVSEPRRKYLWILSRTPKVDEKAYGALLDRLKDHGFDLVDLERTPQSN